MSVLGSLGFVLSLAALLVVAWRIAIEFAGRATDRLWIALATCTLLLGAISITASLLGAYTPAGFFVTQIVISVAALAAARICARRFELRIAIEPAEGLDAPREPLRATEWALIVAIVLTVVPSLFARILMPAHHTDDLNYHASRAAYWIVNESVFPYATHNDRQTTFPFGAELVFAWPLLFTGVDLPGRVLYWLAYPLSILGVLSVVRSIGGSRSGGLFAAMLYAVTPAVLMHTATLKSDIWMPVYVLGAGYWLARAARDPAHAVKSFFWAGVFVALAMNVKTIVAMMVPILVLAPLVVLPWRGAARAIAAAGVGGMIATALSGLAVLLVANLANHAHPLGPGYIRALVQPEYSLRQTYTHAVRLPMFLIDLPENPSMPARAWLTDAGNDAIELLNADEPLPREDNAGWPGAFRFESRPLARAFGLGGMLWLPMLAVGLGLAVVQAVRTFPSVKLSPAAVLALACVPLLLSVVFMLRWMGGGPERFWLAAYALGLALGVGILASPRRSSRVLAVLAILGAAWAVQASATANLFRWQRAASHDRPYRFQAAIDAIPTGSTVLLVSSWNAEDYPLLAPDGRLSNRVVLWGKQPFDPASPARLSDLLEQEGIEFVVLEHGRSLNLGGDRRLPAQPMIRWLTDSAGATLVELDSQTQVILLRVANDADSALGLDGQTD